MTKATVFIHVQGRPGIMEAELPLTASLGDIHDILKAQKIEIDNDFAIFVDERDDHEKDHKNPIEALKHGSRIHVTRCKKIKVTIHYLDKTIHKDFAPGTRVRTVKQWVVRDLKINPTDAGEHVLQLCNTTIQPPTDAPLSELVHGHDCALCFDFVPEKRVEG